MATTELNQEKMEAFGGRMLSLLNDAFLSLLVSIGYRTGLYETMAQLGAPAASERIAAEAGLQERYVREWLGGMVVGGIVEYDPVQSTYVLPAEHAAFLTRAAGPDNLAFFAQYMALVADVEDPLIESFRNGGGVPYSAYPRFQELQGEESARTFDATLVDVVLPLVFGLPDRLAAGIDVLDMGCGQGHAVNLMAKAFPASRFTGYDFSEEGIATARREAEQLGLDNARFEVRNATELDELERYDLVTAFDVVHDLAKPRAVLRKIYEALRPGGTFYMVDILASSRLEENIDHPLGPLLYSASLLHCMTVSLAQGGEGLGAVWGEQKAKELLAEAGFREVELKTIEGDFYHAYYVATKA